MENGEAQQIIEQVATQWFEGMFPGCTISNVNIEVKESTNGEDS